MSATQQKPSVSQTSEFVWQFIVKAQITEVGRTESKDFVVFTAKRGSDELPLIIPAAKLEALQEVLRR